MSLKTIVKYNGTAITTITATGTKTLTTNGKLLNGNIELVTSEDSLELIPTMTSNTTPSGTASCSQNQTDGPAWHAFEGNTDCWFFARSTSAWIKYAFTDTVTIAGSFTVNTGSAATTEITLDTPLSGNYIKIYTTGFASSNTYSGITQIQAYGSN